jgi:ATP-dependent exoDNAse (exonuclease V) beta subunit
MTQIQFDLDGDGVLDADEAARAAIVEERGATLFVEAGAGSGKTRALVDRVVALTTLAGIPMREIVAVTFTEKAATELRDRIRRQLEITAQVAADTQARERARAALDELDGAAVSTLHAFAQRLLVEHPIEAGLPPRVEVGDEIQSQVAFDERWTRFVDRLLDADDLQRTLLLGLATGLTLDKLRALAVACNANWDLVATRMHAEPDPPPLEPAAFVAQLRAVCALAAHSRDPEDLMAVQLAVLDEWLDQLAQAPDEFEQLRLLDALGSRPKVRTRIGRKENWADTGGVDPVRDRLAAAIEQGQQLAHQVSEAAAKRLAWSLAQFTVEEAHERRRAGRLEFHDLLVLARDVLRSPDHGWAVRQYLRERYTHLLLDEFQDTDPIQCEIAALLASADPDAGDRAWDEIVVDPGRLFVVGDPKQSIYRFRRADIAAFLGARHAFGSEPRHLTRNFRTVAPVIEFVNATFGDLIAAAPDSQPEYVPLTAVREAPPAGPAVVLLGTDAHTDGARADELRAREANDVAATVLTALRDQWPVARTAPDGTTTWEPCRLGDFCILLPARTSLDQLEDALEGAGIPARAETSSLVYGTREIRDLLVALQAVDDPTDELALVTALRSPLFGCGDDDLYTFRVEHHGRWDHQAEVPESLRPDHPVADALRTLAAWHDARLWMAPSELLDRIVRERRVLEVGFAHGRPRDLWRRVRFVIDQARAFSEVEGGSLRDFLHWADLQSTEGARVVETVLPETDDDAVRILTIHGAKGLEFPITIVSGMTTAAVRRRTGIQLVFPHDGHTYALKVSPTVSTDEFDRYQPIDEQMDFHEKLRLLYVAATRARDHLVVSVHRKDRTLPEDHAQWTHAELVWHAAAPAPHWQGTAAAASSEPLAAPAPATDRAPAGLVTWAEWEAARDGALAAASVPRVLAATAIARGAVPTPEPAAGDPGLAKDPRDLDLPPWNKGRYGTAVGRAVHAVLQTVDLATGDGIDAAAAAQAAAEGVIGTESDIAVLARAAIASDVVREAVAHGFRREMYVATPVGDRVLEGYVDLVYRTADGLVVVDYKTDAWSSEAELDAKLVRYRLQGASYTLALERATGERVARCVFLFLTPDGAVHRDVEALGEATAEVQAVMASGGALVGR